MDNLVELNKHEVMANPRGVGQELIKLTKELKEHKNNISEIKNRTLVKRLFANNTKDLANSMISQAEIMSSFMDLLKNITGMCMYNVVALTKLYDTLNEESKVVDQYGNVINEVTNEFLVLAQSHVKDALEAAERSEERRVGKEC